MQNKHFNKTVTALLTVEKPSLSMAGVEFGNGMKFKICSPYDQVFAQFLKAEAADFFYFLLKSFIFLQRSYMYISSQ